MKERTRLLLCTGGMIVTLAGIALVGLSALHGVSEVGGGLGRVTALEQGDARRVARIDDALGRDDGRLERLGGVTLAASGLGALMIALLDWLRSRRREKIPGA